MFYKFLEDLNSGCRTDSTTRKTFYYNSWTSFKFNTDVLTTALNRVYNDWFILNTATTHSYSRVSILPITKDNIIRHRPPSTHIPHHLYACTVFPQGWDQYISGTHQPAAVSTAHQQHTNWATAMWRFVNVKIIIFLWKIPDSIPGVQWKRNTSADVSLTFLTWVKIKTLN